LSHDQLNQSDLPNSNSSSSAFAYDDKIDTALNKSVALMYISNWVWTGTADAERTDENLCNHDANDQFHLFL